MMIGICERIRTFFMNLLPGYKTHPEAIVISCFFNPQKSLYRLQAFEKFYKSIQNLNYRIIECAIGDDKFQLPDDPNIVRVRTNTLLWHKETLLNKLIKELPVKYKYVFWIDADVIFENQYWLTESVKVLQKVDILQPFSRCFHCNKNGTVEHHPYLFSFCSNYALRGGKLGTSNSANYNIHGHVGFAWGARREVLDRCPLYDKALIGSADHVIAHAAAGQIPHPCIDKGFKDDLESVYEWSKRFHANIKDIGYVNGDLYHIWHGDVKKREYLKRLQDYNKECKDLEKDENGLYVKNDDKYVRDYFEYREDSTYIEDIFYDLMMLGYYLNDFTTNNDNYDDDNYNEYEDCDDPNYGYE